MGFLRAKRDFYPSTPIFLSNPLPSRSRFLVGFLLLDTRRLMATATPPPFKGEGYLHVPKQVAHGRVRDTTIHEIRLLFY